MGKEHESPVVAIPVNGNAGLHGDNRAKMRRVFSCCHQGKIACIVAAHHVHPAAAPRLRGQSLNGIIAIRSVSSKAVKLTIGCPQPTYILNVHRVAVLHIIGRIILGKGPAEMVLAKN